MSEITMYYKGYCPYCRAAEAQFKKAGIPIKKIEVTNDRKAFAEMKQRSGRHTVPQIFYNDEHIGGHADLQIYLQRHGQLPGQHTRGAA